MMLDYGDSHSTEVQQRAVEYSAMFQKHNNLRPGVLEPMPKFEKLNLPEDEQSEDAVDADPAAPQAVAAAVAPAPSVSMHLFIVNLGKEMLSIKIYKYTQYSYFSRNY